ncbi:DNA-binding response regulator [Rhodopseudomonas sp.]|uniref:DNA-binding response regulator n=1 Tax=Rhodopseudomonas sp. TaxID=1078 RepID=UPI0039E3D59C
MKKTLEQIRIGAAVIDCAGRIVEVSDGWPAPARKRGNSASVVGRSYFEIFIRPDRHSLDLLRGLKNLSERSIDFFATLNWREEAGERRYFLIAAVPRPHAPDRILVLHVDLAALLRARPELSALMIGHGSAAHAQMESEVLGLVRNAIVEALAKPNGGPFPGTMVDGPAEQRLLNELTRP